MTNHNRKLYPSTGAMVGHSNGFDYRRALREYVRLREEGFIDGLELMMLRFYYDKIDVVADAVNASGLADPASVIHCEKDVGTLLSDAGVCLAEGKGDEADALWKTASDLFRLNCDMAEKTGLRRMVLHLWGGISSDAHLDYNAEKLPVLAKTAADSGVCLLIENIPSNHADPHTNWRRLIDRGLPENVGLIYDTRFGKLHDQMTETLSDETIIPHLEHVHISDFAGTYREFAKLRPILHPGEGSVDFAGLARLLDGMGYAGTVTLESPVMLGEEYDIVKLEKTLRYLRELL